MNRRILNSILLTEFAESDSTIVQSAAVIQLANSNEALHNVAFDSIRNQTEDDVYVANFFEEIVPEYSDATFRKHFRMSRETMQKLITEIARVLNETVNVDHMSVPLNKKVHVTVWLLANQGISYRATSDLFGMSKGTAHLIFMQICPAISRLQEKYIKWPTMQESVELAAETFQSTQFPGVVGSIDGCHIPIKAPLNNPIDFYNRKQFHSIVLQGVCDKNLKFIDIYIGMTGKVHDSRIFRNSPLYQVLPNLLPPDCHLLGDCAYPLLPHLLTRFRDNGHLTRQQKIFNKKHGGIRSAIERAFGRLKTKFRRLKYLDMTNTQDIPLVISACCVLHNLILEQERFYDNDENEDEDAAEDDYDCENIDAAEPEDRSGSLKRNRISQTF